jgi:hypothetical protein
MLSQFGNEKASAGSGFCWLFYRLQINRASPGLAPDSEAGERKKIMARMQSKNLSKPEELRPFNQGKLELVTLGVSPLVAPSFSRQTARASNVRIGEAFADLAAKQLLVVGHVASPCDEPLHGVEQFQPVFQRRFGNGLPVVKTPGAMEKTPLALHALNIDLQLLAVLGDAFPTDFCFGGHD